MPDHSASEVLRAVHAYACSAGLGDVVALIETFPVGRFPRRGEPAEPDPRDAEIASLRESCRILGALAHELSGTVQEMSAERLMTGQEPHDEVSEREALEDLIRDYWDPWNNGPARLARALTDAGYTLSKTKEGTHERR